MARADGYLLGPRETRVALTGVLLGLLLAALNQTILTTALPQIVADIGGGEHYSWVFSGYMLALAVCTPVFGRLSDIYGRRPLLLLGHALFVTGAIVGITAGSMGQVILARTIQGAGAGALLPLTYATIADLVPASKRADWQGMVGVTFAAASIIGPASGGWIVDHAHWHWVFVIALPVAATAFATVALTLKIPPHPEHGTRIDYGGAVLLVAGLACLLLGTMKVGVEPVLSLRVGGLLVVSAVVLAAFVAWERGQAQPILPLALFRRRNVGFATAASLTTGMGMFGAFAYGPLFMQGALGDSATASGLVLAPLLVGFMATSFGAGRIITRTGRYRWALLSGPLICGSGFALLASLDEHSTLAAAAVAMGVIGAGLGMFMNNLVLVIQNEVPSRHLGAATSGAQVSRSFGNALGVTVMGAIFLAGLPAGAAVGPLLAEESVSAHVIAEALQPAFLIGIPLMGLTLLLAAVIVERPLPTAVREDVASA